MTTNTQKDVTKGEETIAQMILAIRKKRGLTMKDLAVELKISVQQFQKYEQGKNRIPTGRFFDICALLRVKPNYFFNETHGEKK
jgi:transcriptional regulator with XRE-family HTH domain